MRVVRAGEVERLLPFDECIPVIRQAMIQFAGDTVVQPLRSVVEVGPDRFFGVMPGRLSGTGFFGAKLVAVFPGGDGGSRQRHQGLVALFESDRGVPICVADAEAITAIRTASATAVATEALARADARRLGIFGCGTQARAHLSALTCVRRYESIGVWGRSSERVALFCAEQSERLGVDVRAVASAKELARSSDVLCTVTSAPEPIVKGDWISAGAHINLVGSSIPGPTEVDSPLVKRARYFVDSERAARKQAAEYLLALAGGHIGADHIVAEIGAVLSGAAAGRRDDAEITVYKSLGLVVQDLAAVQHLYQQITDRPGDVGDAEFQDGAAAALAE